MIEERTPWLFANRFSLFARTLFFIFAAALLVYADGHLRLLDKTRLMISRVFTPVVQLMGKSANQAGSITNFFLNTYDLQHRLNTLEREAAAFSAQQARLKALEIENQRLRALLQRVPDEGFSVILAAPLKLGRNPLLTTALIDRGQDDAVQEGAVVMAKEGLIGQVIKTYAHYSEVMLATDSRSLIPAEVNRILVVASGNGEGQIQILYQAVTTPIEKGSMVVTSGIGKIYPSHIHIGTVVSVERNPNMPYARIIVKPAATIDTAPALAVLRPK